MARSRMINDDFWDDPDLASLTHEERCTLLLFLTSKQSNVIGVYRVMWRQIGAGAGWTQDQILNAAKNLQEKNLVQIEEETGWVWVKEWWKHNSIKGAFAGKVATKARLEFAQCPDFWREEIRNWIDLHDVDQVSKPLLCSLDGASKVHPCSLHGAPGNHTPSHNLTQPPTADEVVTASLWRARHDGKQITSPTAYVAAIRARLLKESSSEADLETVRLWREYVASNLRQGGNQ